MVEYSGNSRENEEKRQLDGHGKDYTQVDKSKGEETEMRCSIVACPGTYEQREVVRAVRQGDHIIVIEHIPAEVCDVCGDVLFTPETIEGLESLRRTTAPPERTVPLYRFAEPA
jgi:YgiT-type zinc finger domain-containing protein